MTGESAFRKCNRLISKNDFLRWLDSLRDEYALIGPVREGGQAVFREVRSAKELAMEYESTMLAPGKLFIYAPKEELFRFSMDDGDISVREALPEARKQVIAGVHACDTNAIRYLDLTFLGAFRDPWYAARRENTLIFSLNCMRASRNCFCSSVGAGPFLDADAGYDMLLTDFGGEYLAEIKSGRMEKLFAAGGKEAGADALEHKDELKESALGSFTKTMDMKGLDRLFLDNPEHGVWRGTADERCLSCSNCVMVCPTCFCYNVVDETSMDMKAVRRYRHLDACQDLRFAEVHGGNFRQRRMARLRQFVTHKLDQTGQYGVPGTVGCGRCITWCPTGIDLTEMAKTIQRTA